MASIIVSELFGRTLSESTSMDFSQLVNETRLKVHTRPPADPAQCLAKFDASKAAVSPRPNAAGSRDQIEEAGETCLLLNMGNCSSKEAAAL